VDGNGEDVFVNQLQRADFRCRSGLGARPTN
jgi:hypothetical protein